MYMYRYMYIYIKERHPTILYFFLHKNPNTQFKYLINLGILMFSVPSLFTVKKNKKQNTYSCLRKNF